MAGRPNELEARRVALSMQAAGRCADVLERMGLMVAFDEDAGRARRVHVELRRRDGSTVCPLSTLDLLDLVELRPEEVGAWVARVSRRSPDAAAGA